jgi:hypothetical protein
LLVVLELYVVPTEPYLLVVVVVVVVWVGVPTEITGVPVLVLEKVIPLQ